ncbi:MAG TPA: hypothetical protein VFI17_09120 [Solirubrobacterales bacterium]|nr:hypothetical protein [Solirubrobacterales bacterium]
MIAVADRRNEEPTELLLRALQHPLRRGLLRHYVEADKPLRAAELAELTGHPLSSISHHVRELERCQVIQFVGEEGRCGSVADLYEAMWWVRLTPWAMLLLGLDPEEQRACLDRHIAERREDKEFMDRLKRRGEENRPLLERLRQSEEEETQKTKPKDEEKHQGTSQDPS